MSWIATRMIHTRWTRTPPSVDTWTGPLEVVDEDIGGADDACGGALEGVGTDVARSTFVAKLDGVGLILEAGSSPTINWSPPFNPRLDTGSSGLVRSRFRGGYPVFTVHFDLHDSIHSGRKLLTGLPRRENLRRCVDLLLEILYGVFVVIERSLDCSHAFWVSKSHWSHYCKSATNKERDGTDGRKEKKFPVDAGAFFEFT